MTVPLRAGGKGFAIKKKISFFNFFFLILLPFKNKIIITITFTVVLFTGLFVSIFQKVGLF